MLVRKNAKKILRDGQNKLSAHKAKAWKNFSLYIRTRDCLKTAHTIDKGNCFTCHKIYLFSQLQAGHFIAGRNNAVLFSEQGTHAQCANCNIHKHGNTVNYWLEMERIYDREMIDLLLAESKRTVIYKQYDYDRIAEDYELKTRQLLDGKFEFF
jgi:hypothetical protein